MKPPYPDELVAAVNAELQIVFETLNYVPLPPGAVEAIYQAHARRVLEKHGIEHWTVQPTVYCSAADPGSVN